MKNPRHPLLIGGACLLGLGAVTYFVDALHVASPWLILAGALFTILYLLVARLAKAPTQRQADSMLYEEGESTMMDDMKKRDG